MSKRAAYLTFDDGPHPTATEEILAALEAKGVVGIFFQLGRNIESYPDVTAAVARRGHIVANHTATHPYPLRDLSESELLREIAPVSRMIHEITGSPPTLFPASGGQDDPATKAAVERLTRLKTVDWNVHMTDSNEFESSAEQIEEEIARRVSIVPETEPIIVLLHDGEAHDGDRRETVKAVPAIIEGLGDRFSFPTAPPDFLYHRGY